MSGSGEIFLLRNEEGGSEVRGTWEPKHRWISGRRQVRGLLRESGTKGWRGV